MKNFHYFHIVDYSPWPIITAINSLLMTSSLVYWFHNFALFTMPTSMLLTFISAFLWWRDVIRESTYQGMHTNIVAKGLKIGMILFIISEVMFFLSFFWSFLHSSLSPTIELGMNWPPTSIKSFNPLEIPLLNTAILLASGVSVTWTHYSLMNNKKNHAVISLSITVFLGLLFTSAQMFEYMSSSFSMADSLYGSSFFLMTGFHGIHVIIGTLFLMFTMIRMMLGQLSSTHHLGFEFSAWYWHFVDVVWLFLYSLIYWWGS